MLRQYIIRGGIESRILKNPNAILIGYPGVGKTTMARYIALKFIQSGRPVILITTKVEIDEKDICYDIIEIRDEHGVRFFIPTIFVSEAYERVEDLGYAIIDALSQLGKIIEKIEKDLKSYKPDKFKEFVRKKKYFDERYLEDLSQIFSMGANLYLPLLAIAVSIELIRRILRLLKKKKKKEKLETIGKSDAVIIIDDARDLKIPALLLEKLKIYGVNIIATARVDFEELLEIRKHNVLKWIKEQLGLSDIVLRSLQIEFIPPADFKTFKHILEANNIKFERFSELYIASGGLPAVAIMLYQFYKDDINNALKEIENRIGGWFGIEWMDKESAKKSLTCVYGSIKTLYWRLASESVIFLALVAQPKGVAEDELRAFCERKGEKYDKAIASIKLHGEIIDEREENWITGKQKVYRFNELWTHLPVLIRAVSRHDMDILASLAETQKVLLEIICDKSKKTGVYTDRMILSALGHITELNDYPNWLLDQISLDRRSFAEFALYWGINALMIYPRIGLDLHSVIMDIISKSEKDDKLSMLAACYLHRLSECSHSHGLPSLLRCADQFLIDCSREDVLAEQVAACTSVARSLFEFGYFRDSRRYLEKSRNLLDRINGKIRRIAEVEYNVSYADILRQEDNLKNAEKVCKHLLNDLEELRRSIDEYVKDEIVRGYFSIIGGDPRRKMEIWIKEKLWFTLHVYGWVCLEQDKLDDALTLFNESYKIAKEIGDIKSELINRSLCIRINIIKYGYKGLKAEFEHIKSLWDDVCKNCAKITLDVHNCTLAEYVLANLVINDTYPEDFDDEELSFGCIRGLLLGMIYIVEQIKGLEHKYKKDKVLEALYDCIADWFGRSDSCFAEILVGIIEGKIDGAKAIAKEHAGKFCPTLSRLFGELAEILEENKIDENILNYLIKLFYYYI